MYNHIGLTPRCVSLYMKSTFSVKAIHLHVKIHILVIFSREIHSGEITRKIMLCTFQVKFTSYEKFI